MAVIGAAIGHVPDKKGKHTRPVYLFMECENSFTDREESEKEMV